MILRTYSNRFLMFHNHPGMVVPRAFHSCWKLLAFNQIQLDWYCTVVWRFEATFKPNVGIIVRVYANGPGDLGSISGRVIPKTQKWYLILPCLTLSIIRYGSTVKWSNPGKGVAFFPIPWCSSYRKGGLWVTLDCSRQIYFTT